MAGHPSACDTVRLNDSAARALAWQPFAGIPDLDRIDAGQLATAIRSAGLARDNRGALLVPGVSFRVPDIPDLVYRGTQRNCWHLDNHPAIHVHDQDDLPHIGHDDQVLMLKHGILLSRIVIDLASRLPDQPPLTCITGTNTTNGTFRFHQQRPGEHWLLDDLDGYTQDMLIVIDSDNTHSRKR